MSENSKCKVYFSVKLNMMLQTDKVPREVLLFKTQNMPFILILLLKKENNTSKQFKYVYYEQTFFFRFHLLFKMYSFII